MVKPMARFEHGGDVYTHADAVDFSANINPLGMPQVARDAIVAHMEAFEAYPDSECRELRRAIARVEGTSYEHIVCTAGASDLFQRICNVLRPRLALVTAPCFSGYEEALEQAGAHIVRHALREDDDFGVTESLLRFTRRDLGTRSVSPNASDVASGERNGSSMLELGAGPRGVTAAGTPAEQSAGTAASSAATRASVDESGVPDMLFLCNPNNPTGLTLDRGLLERVLDEARGAGVTVVLDECFLDFTGEPSAVELCSDHPNLIIARAFTKMYAMAGLRVGYGICSDEELVVRLAGAGQPWAVSGPAQVAATAALADSDWVQRTRCYVDEQRELLAGGLRECGMRVIPGRANYLLFQSGRALYEPLLQRGFLIRRCGNFQGLDESWYRIAVRTATENEAFLRALREVCA